MKCVKPPLSPSFIEDRHSAETTPKSSTSSSILPPQRALSLTFDPHLNRHSVEFLISGTIDSYDSSETSSKPPILDQKLLTQREFRNESPPVVISREIPPTKMRDVAQILSTLKDKVLPHSSTELCICQNRGNGVSNNYWRTVLDCTFCEKKSKETLGVENQENRSLVSSSTVSQPSRSIGGRISKVHRCSDCGGTFKQRGALVSHQRGVHQGIRNYICDIGECTAAYKYRGGNLIFLFIINALGLTLLFFIPDLNRHKSAIHANIKPFPCAMCGIQFARKSVRDRHSRKKHA